MNSSVSALTVSAPLSGSSSSFSGGSGVSGRCSKSGACFSFCARSERLISTGLALFARVHADLLVAAPLPGAMRERVCRFEQKAGYFRDAQPGDADEQAETHGDRRQHEQRRAGKTGQAQAQAREQRTDDPAGVLRQDPAKAVQAQRFERRARDDQQAEPRSGDPR